MTTSYPYLRGWKLFWLCAVLTLITAGLALTTQTELSQRLLSAIRVTARTSFVLFFAAFIASALAVLVPNGFTQGMLRERRYLGLAFAFSHLVHAILIITFGQVNTAFWPSRDFIANAPGTTAYVFILLMAITSFKSPARLIGPKAWKALHLTGMWVITGVFGYAYFKRIPMEAWYTLPFGMICGAVAIRWVGKWAQSNKRYQLRTQQARAS
ncbi:ferric reductase-like transmembrane domain-containing protein [Gallaecimonas pentaromativorans]|uniref:ferric reductase-like transmembrane domain-containing protein n=1 Tax=Gallaecimonas pentaromativorans TaxID=584787 RepID=UPI003A939756